MDCSTPGLPTHHQLPEFTQTHVHWVVIPSNHLILCHPLLLLPSIFLSIRVFSNESVLHIRWAKYWSFSFRTSPPNEYSGLISFRMDWLDLLAVQGTLKRFSERNRRQSILSVQLLSPDWLFATPWTAALATTWTAAHQASLSISNSWSWLKLMSIESVMPFNHLILCRPLLLLPSIFPSIRVFSNESVLHIRWPKYWSFGFSISPSYEYSGLISFRMDWLDFLAVQETFKGLLQPQFKSINSLVLSFLHSSTFISVHDYWKNHSLD